MRRALLALVLLATPAAVPGAASAGEAGPLLPPPLPSHLLTEHGGPVRPAPIFRSGFVAETSNGYKVGVSTSGSAVMLEVWRGEQGRRTSTAYVARGVSAPERLQATFGKFGRVSMRFHESRNRTWFGKRRSCRGSSRFVRRQGTFAGSLRFRGEGGYVSVRLHRAKGAVVTEAEKCRGRRSRGPLPDFGFLFFDIKSALLAIARDGVDSTAFLALEGGKKTLFFASDEETRGSLAILRFAVLSKQSSLHFNEALTAGGLSPSSPFHGTGRYRAGPDGSTSWSGDLSIDFPGMPRFPLTGPEFDATIEVPF
jgi:hypothetical protein